MFSHQMENGARAGIISPDTMAIAEGFKLHERNKASVNGKGGSDAGSYGGRWGI